MSPIIKGRPVEPHQPSGWIARTGDNARQRSLACARCSQHADDLAWLQLEVDAVEDGAVVMVHLDSLTCDDPFRLRQRHALTVCFVSGGQNLEDAVDGVARRQHGRQA